MAKDWNLLLPLSAYTQAENDDNEFENNISGETSPSFPHKLSKLTKTKYAAIRTTPHGTSMSFDLAKAALINEQMGKGEYTDFLALSTPIF